MDNDFKSIISNKKIAIIGLGLIGGSLARALRERLDVTNIVAVNRNPESLEQALKDKVISLGFTDLSPQIMDSDIIFICTPVKRALEYINALAGKVKPRCIITDVGSTKSEMISYINSMSDAPCFIGGHPMAGAEKTGYLASFSHLFENAYYILTPCKTTSDSVIEFMTQLVKGIGAIPITLDADQHDIITGSISHVPHIIASALVNMVNDLDTPDGKMRTLAAGGFKDITRIASSSPEMWENIVLSNKQHVANILETYIGILNRYKDYIEAEDSNSVLDFFNKSKQFRDTFSNAKKGLIHPSYEIIVDVVDKPGIIGEIATILGANEINIKNINVSNSREYEQGCLRITLSDSESVKRSYNLLSDKGYKVFK